MARPILTQREQFAFRFADAGDALPCDPTKDPTAGGCSTEAPTGPKGHAPAPSAPALGGPSSTGPSVQAVPAGNAGGSGGGPGAPVSYTPSAGVEQWRSHVEEGLRRNNLPTSLADQVLHQMQTESSGNPNAINNWDSNAAAGHPSQGLMQTIPSTFQQYHLQGDSDNINDPQANIDSAIGYAKATYGPSLMNSSGSGMGSGKGY